MKRILIGLLAGGTGGIAVGFALGIFIYPFWFLTDVASEELLPASGRVKIAEGTFLHPNPKDPVHWGKGTVSLYRDGDGSATVFLNPDFEVGPGPRFHVYLADRESVATRSDFLAAKTVDLGRLRAFRGSQVYTVPRATDVSGYRSVVIWCKEFGVLISPASLMAAKAARGGPALLSPGRRPSQTEAPWPR